jgi:aromatic-amino-acid transaminase
MTATTLRPSTLISAAQNRPADDPIFQLNAEATRRAQAGESIVNATLGALMEDDGTLAVLPTMVEALRAVPAKRAAAYAPISGDAPYLAAVVEDVFGGTPLASSTVAAATPGGTGALHHAIALFLEPGQSLLTTNFHWSPYDTLAAQARRGVREFRMFDAQGGFDLAAYERGLDECLAEQGRALVFHNTPCHNPTGYSLDEAEWRAVARLTRAAGERAPVAFLLDMAYARFGNEASQRWSHHAEEILESCTFLVAWTGSKSLAQYGARIGALLACSRDPEERARIKNALAFACRGTWSNCNHAGILAATEVLSKPELRAKADEERARLVGLLDERVSAFNRAARQRGLAHPRYEGGFFVSVFVRDAERTAASMRADGVYVVPMEGAVRVALCSTSARDVERLVDSLAKAEGRA